jgi:hypothetical protein
MEEVKQRLRAVQERILRAVERRGGEPSSITLVAVTKTLPVSMIRAAYEAGQRIFGENYVKELAAKAEELSDLRDLSWHFVGHLQRNKVKRLLSYSSFIHTIDSSRLLWEVEKRAASLDISVSCLVQVNIGGEEQKSGIAPESLKDLLFEFRDASHLKLLGLMTMPPYFSDPELARPYFRRLRRLRDELGKDFNLPELSMGMSNDFEIAIEEGATIVRIGTAIFGPR